MHPALLPPLCRTLVGLILGIAVARAAEPPGSAVAEFRGALIINEDNSHFFGSRPPEAMTREGLEAWVDQYAGTAVTHLFLNPNAMRTSFRSRTRDAIWDPVDGVEPAGLWPQNAKRLHEAGLDPYRIWIERSRERGLSPWITVRMNDVHSVDEPDSYMHSEFWRRNPGLRRVPGGPVTPWVNQALNYVHPEVREHQMALIDELLRRYEPDGLELDWMRFGWHLPPGREREEAGLLAAFVRDVRARLDARQRETGRRLRLGVRVPAHPDAAAGLGLDAVAWAKEGWVDLIVPSPFWTTSDFDIPIELWKAGLGDAVARVAVIPALEHNTRAWPAAKPVPNDLASARGFAATALGRGAEAVYLFNWMDSQTRPVSAEAYAELLRVGLGRAALGGRLRRHPVAYRDTVPPDFDRGVQLPVGAQEGGPVRVALGLLEGVRTASVVLGLTGDAPGAGETWELQVNGRRISAEARPVSVDGLGTAVWAREIPVRPGDLVEGQNLLHPRLRDGAGRDLVWVEIRLGP
jgi:hypothetical protein